MLIIPALTGHVVGAARSYSRRTVRRGAPTRTRHRFYWARPSSLCLWFAGDRPSMRWTLRDGLPSLIDLSRVHLVKESWWRVTSDWSGCEKRREPPRGDEQRPRNPKPRPIDALRISRRRCWCGRGRYRGCQGGIDANSSSTSWGSHSRRNCSVLPGCAPSGKGASDRRGQTPWSRSDLEIPHLAKRPDLLRLAQRVPVRLRVTLTLGTAPRPLRCERRQSTRDERRTFGISGH
jgi:hypothetical protein